MHRRAFAPYLALLIFTVIPANAQLTAFAYQGALKDGGNPANGAYQMQFKLFDAASGGTQIGSTIADVTVTAAQGVFSVKLDFGANALSGANRFLEIAVRHNSGESYITLTPREQIASAPYSVRTLSAASADALSQSCLGCVQDQNINSLSGNKVTGPVANAINAVNSQSLGSIPANQFVQTSDPRLSDQRNPLPGSNSYIQNTQLLQAGGTVSFNIAGNGRLGGNLGVGTESPAFKADIRGSLRAFNDTQNNVDVIAETNGFTNYAQFRATTATRDWRFGTSNDFQNQNQFFLKDQTTGQFRITIQPDGGPIAFPFGNLGIGTSSPTARLHVQGPSFFDGSVTGTFVLAPVNGGTGLNSPGSTGNFLRSSGGTWTSSLIQSGDIPFGSNFYIQNTNALQTANFNISGDGLIGGRLGIGINPSTFKLDVAGNARIFNTDHTFFEVQSFGSPGSGAFLSLSTVAGKIWTLGTKRGVDDNQFFIEGDVLGLPTKRMTIKPDDGPISFPIGNVGIGTDTPNAKLTVEGNVAITGNTTQSPDKGGWAKVLVYASENGSILWCFNGVSGNSSSNCGLSITHSGPGSYQLNLDFTATHRIVLVTTSAVSAQWDYCAAQAWPSAGPTNAVFVKTFRLGSTPPDTDCRFMLAIF